MRTSVSLTGGLWLIGLLSLLPAALAGEETPDLFTTHGNSELPNVLYITPWRAPETEHKTQQLTLHSLYGDLFDPIDPKAFAGFVQAYQSDASPSTHDPAEHR